MGDCVASYKLISLATKTRGFST